MNENLSRRPAERNLRIVILEDNPADSDLVELVLSKAGILFTAKRVETRESFERELRDSLPDAILADYSLPGFTAMDALRIAKQIAPALPFILVTGTQSEEVAVECMKQGVD